MIATINDEQIGEMSLDYSLLVLIIIITALNDTMRECTDKKKAIFVNDIHGHRSRSVG